MNTSANQSPAPRQHTPGPWTVDNQYIHGPDGIRFLAVAGDVAGQANARLIASAPDLLAALYSIATDPSAIYSGANAHIGDIARAAIAKATATK